MPPALPYRSQQDQDAAGFSHDCGPACCAMLIQGMTGIQVSIDALACQTTLPVQAKQVADGKMKRADMGLTPIDLQELLRRYGIASRYYTMLSEQGIDYALKRGEYVVPLIQYGMIPGRQATSSTGLHYVVIYNRVGGGGSSGSGSGSGSGSSGEKPDTYIVADPLWWQPRRDKGAAFEIRTDTLIKSMQSTRYQALVITGLEQNTHSMTHYVNNQARDGLNVRYTPSRTSSIIAKLHYKQPVALDLTVPSITADRFTWSKLRYLDGWVANKYLSPIKFSPGLPEGDSLYVA